MFSEIPSLRKKKTFGRSPWRTCYKKYLEGNYFTSSRALTRSSEGAPSTRSDELCILHRFGLPVEISVWKFYILLNLGCWFNGLFRFFLLLVVFAQTRNSEFTQILKYTFFLFQNGIFEFMKRRTSPKCRSGGDKIWCSGVLDGISASKFGSVGQKGCANIHYILFPI